jgi:hypothetical protein
VAAGRTRVAADYWQGERGVSTLGLPRLLSIAPTGIALSREPLHAGVVLSRKGPESFRSLRATCDSNKKPLWTSAMHNVRHCSFRNMFAVA